MVLSATSVIRERLSQLQEHALFLLLSCTSCPVSNSNHKNTSCPKEDYDDYNDNNDNSIIIIESSKSRDSRNCYEKRMTCNATHMTCDACEGQIYPTDNFTRAFSPTRVFHLQCFKCYLCQGYLKHHRDEVCVEIPKDEDKQEYTATSNDDVTSSSVVLCLLCHPCQQASLSKHTDKVDATRAGRRVQIKENELGDVNGVLDEIGCELEKVMMQHYVPTCTICGGTFLSYDSNKVVMLGPTLKYHYECWETGKPSVEVQERKLSPIEALKYLPNEIIIRIKGGPGSSSSSSSSSSVVTIYFVWKDRLDNTKRIIMASKPNNDNKMRTVDTALRIEYSQDQPSSSPAANTGLYQKHLIPWIPFYQEYTIEVIGDSFGSNMNPTQALIVQEESKEVSMTRGCIKFIRFGLLHEIVIETPLLTVNQENDPQMVLDVMKATCIVRIDGERGINH